ncbi:cupin domain-containing protein [Legionella sp. WA2022007384]
MSQLLETDICAAPGLVFSNPEHIAPGVVVNPIDFAQKKASPPFQTTYFQVLPQCETPVDYHQEEEIWIVLEGGGILTYEGEVHCLKVHDFFYFAAFKKHQIRNSLTIPLLICSIYW